MTKSDPDRARRLVAGLTDPRERACGWALVALGLADRDPLAARSALDEAIRLIDRLSGPPNIAEAVNRWVPVAGNPAASILPIVERVAPERLEEVFWKAIALVPSVAVNPGRVNFAPDLVTFLARYDRQVADVFLTLGEPFRSRNPVAYVYSSVAVRTVADPRGAVAMFEALPPADPDRSERQNRIIDQARARLIEGLVGPIDEAWKEVWRGSGIPIDKPRFR